jgi:coenzyme F420-reducing hydrogenase beta subunit
MSNVVLFKNKNECSGCMACANSCPKNAISMTADEYGFYYPIIDETKCVGCKKCVSVCEKTKNIALRKPLKCFAATHKDEMTLNSSSSGGAFSALADYILENNGLICGCIMTNDFDVIHVLSNDMDVIEKMKKSKYVQSNVGDVYKEIKNALATGRLILYTGTPCQVAGLLSAIDGEKYDNLITIDIVCHGVPNNLLFHQYISYLEKKYKSKIVSFDFRSKKYGWKRFTSSITTISGKNIAIGKYGEFYHPAFTGGNTMRESCFSCRFSSENRVGDFTIADCWGYEKLPIPFEFNNGLSTLLFNTQKALNLMRYLSEKMNLFEYDYEMAVSGNTCLREPTKRGARWGKYMEAIKNNTIDEMAKDYLRRNWKKVLVHKIKDKIPTSLYMKFRKFYT